jgi:hypothetical protein
MASTLRTRRFRKHLFAEAELIEKRVALEKAILPLKVVWQNHAVCEAEVVAKYIYNFLKVMRPSDFLGGPHSVNLTQTSLESFEAIKIFSRLSLRSVPLAVNRSLVAWAEGRYPLRLLDYVPTAQQILDWQSQGQRIVTCFFKPEELTKWVEGSRDPVGFVMHDLIHADHFFCDQDLARDQVAFYKTTKERFEQGEFAEYFLRSTNFQKQFEYIISDMNSHPAHLELSLQKIIEEANLC